jgi:hypothetical protein
MVDDRMPGDLARGLCPGDNRQKIPPLRVAQQMLKIARQPELHAIARLLRIFFKGCRQAPHKFRFH